MRLILVRHGETVLNREGRILGHNEEPLTERGRGQAIAVAQALYPETPFTLYASPLSRALETAQIIAQKHQVDITPLEGLKEVDVGELDGMSIQEMRRSYPEFARLWAQDAAATPMPGGESPAHLQQRAWKAVVTILERNPTSTTVAVTHAFTIYTLLCKALGVPLNNFQRFHINVGSTTTLEIAEDKATLISFNDCCHLRSLKPAEGA